MPYPNSGSLNIVIAQTSASAISPGQFPFVETIISGSNLVLQTNAAGQLVGLPAGTITTVSASTIVTSNLTASNISASGNLTASNAFIFNLTASNISASGVLSASNAWVNNLTVQGTLNATASNAINARTASYLTPTNNYTVNQLTSSALDSTYIRTTQLIVSASISSVAALESGDSVYGSIIDILTNNPGKRDAVLRFASGSIGQQALSGWTMGYDGTDSSFGISPGTYTNSGSRDFRHFHIDQTGNVGIGTASPANRLTINGNVSASSITASISVITPFLSASSISGSNFFGTSSRAVLSQTASFLTPTNNYRITNLAASYISASNIITSSGVFVVTNTNTGSRLTLDANVGTLMGSSSVNDMLILNSCNGPTAGTTSNRGAAWGIKFVGGDGSDPAFNNSNQKTCAIYAVSEDTTTGFNRGTSLAFYTNQLPDANYAEKLRIGHNGNVGIGTINAVNKLEVVGNISASSITASTFVGSASFALSASTSVTSQTASFLTTTNRYTVNQLTSSDWIRSGTGLIAPTLTLSSSNSFLAPMESSDAQYGGIVDIITNNPGRRDAILRFASGSNGSAWAGWTMGYDGTDGSFGIASGYFTNSASRDTRAIHINQTGNVGIGTTSPANKLTINGNVSASSITASSLIVSGMVSASIMSVLTFSAQSVSASGLNATAAITDTLVVSSPTQATSWTNGALIVTGGVGVGRNLYVSGSLTVVGDLTLLGSSSIVNITSSQVNFNDNIIRLNAFSPFERYAGLEANDSGSANTSGSLLWDGQDNHWISVDQTGGSGVLIIGPSGSIGSEGSLTINTIPKAYDNGGITNSSLTDDGTILRYGGSRISGSALTITQLTASMGISSSGAITASNLWVGGSGTSGTGSITYASGVLVTYTTGSFTILTIQTGSSPGVGLAPANANSVGMPGQIEVDNNYMYIYTNNIWKRVPLSVWVP